jgi:hypothetical protein
MISRMGLLATGMPGCPPWSRASIPLTSGVRRAMRSRLLIKAVLQNKSRPSRA